MKLYKNVIKKYLFDTLCILQNYKILDGYNLVGGTALSFHLGHRISDDIDLFGKNDFSKDILLDFIDRKISKDIRILNSEGSIFQILLNENKSNELKIDIVKYPYDLLDPIIKTEEGLRIVGLNDIAAMKMSATGTRGNEAKDYIDLYYLLKYMSIEKIIDNFKKKYNTEDIAHYQRSMVYFDDIPIESWNAIKLMDDKLSIEKVKNKIIKEVGNYERNIFNNETN